MVSINSVLRYLCIFSVALVLKFTLSGIAMKAIQSSHVLLLSTRLGTYRIANRMFVMYVSCDVCFSKITVSMVIIAEVSRFHKVSTLIM